MAKCRACSSSDLHVVVDLGTAPPSNAYLRKAELASPELVYPLVMRVCGDCWLVQADAFHQSNQIFDANYAYFSSFSSTWMDHSRRFAEDMRKFLDLESTSLVLEVACNDGYLLQYFAEFGVPTLGIEPTLSTASVARSKGVEVVTEFFGLELARELHDRGVKADLIVSNNVLGHVPDVNDFLSGYSMLLKDEGLAVFEFPHLVNLIEQCQFDTIYHEHFSYLSLSVVRDLFSRHGLEIVDVERLKTHGGSLRVFAAPSGRHKRNPEPRVGEVLAQEIALGTKTLRYYTGFGEAVARVKNQFLRFLLGANADGRVVTAYGAAAKGNTFLNYAGVRSDLIRCVADRNPAKVGKFLPGSRIPVVSLEAMMAERPDFVVVLPWNLRDELVAELESIRSWGGQLVFAIPTLDIV
jgi:SAM-dependent methyltransferase